MPRHHAVHKHACPARHFRWFEDAVAVYVHPAKHFGRIIAATSAEAASIKATTLEAATLEATTVASAKAAPTPEPAFVEATTLEAAPVETTTAKAAATPEPAFVKAAEPSAPSSIAIIIVFVPAAAVLGGNRSRD